MIRSSEVVHSFGSGLRDPTTPAAERRSDWSRARPDALRHTRTGEGPSYHLRPLLSAVVNILQLW